MSDATTITDENEAQYEALCDRCECQLLRSVVIHVIEVDGEELTVCDDCCTEEEEEVEERLALELERAAGFK